MSSDVVIKPARNLAGSVRLPGDKSISHRYAMLSALAEGASRLEHYASGADCRSTLNCITALGAKFNFDGDVVTVDGVGRHGLTRPSADLDAGNSGSTIRMLSGILAAQPFASRIGGDASLSRRPMMRVIEPLTAMGARIQAAEGGRPPVTFEPPANGLHAIEYRLPVASAQVKTAILFAGLFAKGVTAVEEPARTRDHSEIALRNFGATVRARPGRIEIEPPAAALKPQHFRIPGDPSSAAFFLCAGALFRESQLVVEEVSLNPSRARLLDVLRRIGARIELAGIEDRGGELVGNVQIGGANGEEGRLAVARRGRQSATASASAGLLSATKIAGAETVALIDEIPVLAVLATATDGGIEFADACELRVKESDRIASIARNLRAMGASCEERADRLFVPGPQRLHGARIQTFSDHRIAMAFSIAGLIAEGETLIEDAECASISFPDFYRVLEQIAQR